MSSHRLACLVLCLALLGCDGIVVRPSRDNSSYHDYDELTTTLRDMSRLFPDLTRLYSVGKSVRDRDLWVLRVTSPRSAVLGTPNVKFVGNIHGNEPVGKELILHLAEYLLVNYRTDPNVTWLLDRTVIHLLPSLNPDGFEEAVEGDCNSNAGRANGNHVDLNRSFPDYFQENAVPKQPETEAIINWLSSTPFVLSGSFHGGTLVANYPFENAAKTDSDISFSKYSTSPDDDTFRYLAETYANNHLTMHNGNTCRPGLPGFPGGITNGAAWYKITGGMQDYNYVWHGCMELTLEISCCKYPAASQLPRLWAENKKAMLAWAKLAHVGLRGMVLDAATGRGVAGAVLNVDKRSINFTSAQTGEFWRILLPGDYLLRVQAEGYKPQEFPFSVKAQNESYPEPTWLNVYLKPGASEPEASGSGFKYRSASLFASSLFMLGRLLM